MRIEEIEKKSLEIVKNDELYSLRLRFLQLWGKNFTKGGNQIVGDLKKSEFLNKYKLLINKMNEQGLIHSTQEIDRALFKKSMAKIKRDNKKIKAVPKQEIAKMNSPTFAYLSVYNKLPDEPLTGKTDFPKRTWDNIEVDKEFSDKWLEDLNNISDIEIRATDIGHSKERVAFVVFRFKDKNNDSKAKDTAENLSKIEGLYCKSDIGVEERPRICVAGKIKLGDTNWESWWDSLADKIKSVVEKKFEKTKEKIKMRFLKIDKKEYIVGGIVYPADETDTQGDRASGSEIWEALKKYMINKKNIKIMHKGRVVVAPIIENYQAWEDTYKGGHDENHLIKKGDWYMSIYLGNEKEVFNDVQSGKLSGFSMAGIARK